MSDATTKPRIKVRSKTERPRLHKVILINDDYTPREFVVSVLKAEFRMSREQAYRVMMTAHPRLFLASFPGGEPANFCPGLLSRCSPRSPPRLVLGQRSAHPGIRCCSSSVSDRPHPANGAEALAQAH